jgi:cytoskeletal protein CcmA (bactofilin family)
MVAQPLRTNPPDKEEIKDSEGLISEVVSSLDNLEQLLLREQEERQSLMAPLANFGLKKSLEDRTIFCANCEANRTLSVSSSGVLSCSTCGSESWMYLPVTASVKQSVSIKGELTAVEDLTIEGRVEGRVELNDHNLWVGPHGIVVNADIHAKNVIVAGTVVGNIYASEMVQIKLSGKVEGNIRCSRIAIVDGATFKGRVTTEVRTNIAVGVGSPKVASPLPRRGHQSASA